jgi:GDPmannose 4,6-dehydratase
MKKKTALIFGVTGQDGAYLSRFLLKKKYRVIGVKRRSSNHNTQRLDDIYVDPHNKTQFKMIYGDLADSISVNNIINEVLPDEIYNLAAQSHVKVSFDIPEYSSNINALGVLRILESIKSLRLKKKIKFYQAGSSEMFGSTKPPQNEKSLFYPRSPYAVSKIFAHWMTINYREAFDIFACNGILFNHESPFRGATFVTKKIISALCNIKKGSNEILYLGNIYAKRDWGHAEDYVKGMYAMMQHKQPDDFVLATGKTYSVKDFCKLAFQEVNLDWKKYVEVDKKFFRPSEVDYLIGDPSKAKKILKWEHKLKFSDLVKLMVHSDLKKLQNK